MTAAIKVKIDEESLRKADELLGRLPLELRTKVLEKGLKDAAKPMANKAEELAPDSIKSGSRQGWSRKMRERRAGVSQHKETIGTSTVRSYGDLTAIYVGPLYPSGNLINVIGHAHAQMLWGRASGAVIPPNTYLEKAAEQTAGEQNAAFVDSIQKGVNRLLAGAK